MIQSIHMVSESNRLFPFLVSSALPPAFGTCDQSCRLAEACTILLLLLASQHMSSSNLMRCRCHALMQSITQQDKQQWTVISASLYNTYRYYSQFVGLMHKAISAGLAELEKQLEVTDLLFMLWAANA